MKAVSLFSGGLDSQLAAMLIKKQGIEIIGVNFTSPFFGADEGTIKAAQDLGIEFQTIDAGQEYMQVLHNPVYGYGKNMNPCIDCHAFMLRKAGQFMEKIGASFLITGEVVGQRPMSQNKSSLNAVEKLSEYHGLIVRPLSAKLLPITIPEQEGWIERDKLLDISGRGRTRQMELANKFGITDYPSPAGGCLLTEQSFARRLKSFLDINPEPPIHNLNILKYGRHFYLDNHNLLIVGRNHSDNENIYRLTLPDDYLLKVMDHPGPVGLLRLSGKLEDSIIEQAAAIVARYSDAKNKDIARIKVFRSQGEENYTVVEVAPMPPEKVPSMV